MQCIIAEKQSNQISIKTKKTVLVLYETVRAIENPKLTHAGSANTSIRHQSTDYVDESFIKARVVI